MQNFFGSTSLGLLGSILLFIPSVFAGPKDAYNDACLYVYKHNNGEKLCLTKQGRVFTSYGSLAGYLNRDHITYSTPVTTTVSGCSYVHGGGYRTVRYEAVNNNNTVVQYACGSDANGSCRGDTSKHLFQYSGTN